MAPASCCTCASMLSLQQEAYDPSSEKPIRHKTLPCCGRQICVLCIEKTPRFETYCPFCQTTRLPTLSSNNPPSTSSSSVPADAPPAYSTLSPIPRHTPPPAPRPHHATLSFSSESRPSSPILIPLPPPAYTASNSSTSRPFTPPYDLESSSEFAIDDSPAADVKHYLHPDDTFSSISLSYNVPVHVLKQHNTIHADHLLSARRYISIPASHYRGPSLSPHPLEDPLEAARKAKIRRLMVKCKVAEYKVAVMYLEEAGWELEKAEEKVEADDRWERENPVRGTEMRGGSAFGNRGRGGLRFAEPLSPRRIARLLS